MEPSHWWVSCRGPWRSERPWEAEGQSCDLLLYGTTSVGLRQPSAGRSFMALVSTGICLSSSSLPMVTTPRLLLLALTQEGVTSYVSCLLFVLFSF